MCQTSRPGAEPLVGLSDQAAWRLQLLNLDGVASRQTPPDSVQFAVAVLFITQILAPLRRRVLTGKHSGGFQIRPGFNQVVEDLDPIFRIPADCKIINEQNLDSGIVLLESLKLTYRGGKDEHYQCRYPRLL